MSKKTLYITFDGLTDPLGQSQILPYLLGICDNSYEITILSCEKKERLKKDKNTIIELIKNTSIKWQYIIYDEEGSAISRFFYLKKLNNIANKLHSIQKFEIIHCRSYLSALIGLKFKVKHKVPFIFDMRGFWADERIDGNIWQKNKLQHRLFYNYFKKKEKQFLRSADAIVSLTNNGVAELTKTYPQVDFTQKTTVIPCCCNVQLFNKSSIPSSFSLPYISPNDHLVIYTGSIGTWYFTKEVIDCILIWKNYIPNLKLLVVTRDIEELKKVLDNYPKSVLEIIISLSSSYQDIPKYLSLAKAAIFFIKPAYSKVASSPTKMAECWAMNLPIITNSGIGDNDIYFKNNLGGILINNFTTEDYEGACINYIEALKQKNDYRKIALKYFDTKDAITKYTMIYNNLSK
ncbi:MAG: glycosyltransferase [Bacteroidota bacterium]|nr:glycosyltransferase [Bacteroidota bacterium]